MIDDVSFLVRPGSVERVPFGKSIVLHFSRRQDGDRTYFVVTATEETGDDSSQLCFASSEEVCKSWRIGCPTRDGRGANEHFIAIFQLVSGLHCEWTGQGHGQESFTLTFSEWPEK